MCAVRQVSGSVPNPRWDRCPCQQRGPKTFRPTATWLKGRTSPERCYLETKWASLIPYEKVAELLILRPDMPRSLAACTQEVLSNLTMIANEQSSETLRRAGRLRADLQYGRIDEILATGLHAYLTQFLERVGTLGVGISRDFLVPVQS